MCFQFEIANEKDNRRNTEIYLASIHSAVVDKNADTKPGGSDDPISDFQCLSRGS